MNIFTKYNDSIIQSKNLVTAINVSRDAYANINATMNVSSETL